MLVIETNLISGRVVICHLGTQTEPVSHITQGAARLKRWKPGKSVPFLEWDLYGFYMVLYIPLSHFHEFTMV